MKKLYNLLILAGFLISLQTATAQTYWDGPTIIFTKADSADWTLEENQDRITDNVWITRQNQWSIFNIAQGDITEFTDCSEDPGQPYDTEWAWGTIADGVENLTFDNFLGDNFTNCGPGGFNGVEITHPDSNAVLHLITDDIYINIKWLSWSQGNGGGGSPGGGFSYERAAGPAVSATELDRNLLVTVFPNPAQSFIRIEGPDAMEEMNYNIFAVSGANVKSGNFIPGEAIDIEELPRGLYFVQMGEYQRMVRFVKF